MDADIISAFTEQQAARLTGLTVHRLRHWDRTKFFQPAFGEENRRMPFSRVYSFKDLLSLQILKVLRLDLKCSLQHLRQVKHKLLHMGDDRWARTTLYVLNRRVVFHDEMKGEFHEAVSGQIVMKIIALKAVRADMRAAVAEMNKRDQSEVGKIVRKRNVSHNAAVIAGTRIPVGAVARLAEDGLTIPQILSEYPSLTEADVTAAPRYAKEKHAA